MSKVFLSCFFLTCTSLFAQTDLELVQSTVDQSEIKSLIYHLASDELQGREVGTAGIDSAANYIADKFQSYGVSRPEMADSAYFPKVLLREHKNKASVQLSLNEEHFQKKNLLVLHPGNLYVNTDAIFLNYGSAEDFAEIEKQDVKDKIVLVRGGQAGDSTGNLFQLAVMKRKLAREAGALAIVEIYQFDKEYWRSVRKYLSHNKMEIAEKETAVVDLPHIWLDYDITFLSEFEIGDEIDVTLTLQGGGSRLLSSYNIVGIVEGTDPKLRDEYIIYSAHYDHVGVGEPNADMDSIYNGARDNAVGVVTVLAAAENIAKYPTKRSALFILFTGEEKGLLGSKWYVENPVIPLKQSVFCFNSDNASYNDTTKVTIVGLERTTASENIKQAAQLAGLSAIDDPAPEQNLFDRSDNVHFAKKGIPAPTFSMGFTAFDAELFKYYHQVTDNPETLDYEYLTKFFTAYVLSCRKIANDLHTPVWVEGDKYYEAGVNLYKDN